MHQSGSPRLGFFTRLLDVASPAERYRLATEQIVPLSMATSSSASGRPSASEMAPAVPVMTSVSRNEHPRNSSIASDMAEHLHLAGAYPEEIQDRLELRRVAARRFETQPADRLVLHVVDAAVQQGHRRAGRERKLCEQRLARLVSAMVTRSTVRAPRPGFNRSRKSSGSDGCSDRSRLCITAACGEANTRHSGPCSTIRPPSSASG